MKALALARLLKSALGASSDALQITAHAVNTPAGGITRALVFKDGVVTPIQCFDYSYPAGTAVCTLVEKFRWKLGDPSSRGAPPFKRKLAPGAWNAKAEACLAAVRAATGLALSEPSTVDFETLVFEMNAELTECKTLDEVEDNASAAYIIAKKDGFYCSDAATTDDMAEIIADIIAADVSSVAAAKALVEAELAGSK